MSIFSQEINENNGRMGVIEIDNKSIVTPTYAPTKNEFVALANTEGIEKKDYKKAKIGEYVCWLNNEQLTNLKNKDGTYNSKKASFKAELKNIDASTKIIHYNFFEDVKTIDIDQLEILLDLQFDSGADVIQIPNLNKDYDYAKAIEKALAWKIGKNIDNPLMGIICKRTDLEILKKRTKSVESIGINLSPFNKPLLIGVKNKLKMEDVWIHGISAPIRYPLSEGTLGILINYYGIDTISSYVMNWRSAQGYGGKIAKMTDVELANNVLTNKYFKPTDYGTPTFNELIENYGDNYKLSNFCNCPVCNNITIQNILDKPYSVTDTNRSHKVISFINEGLTYQNKLKNNETSEYINSKSHAKNIIK